MDEVVEIKDVDGNIVRVTLFGTLAALGDIAGKYLDSPHGNRCNIVTSSGIHVKVTRSEKKHRRETD